MVEQKAPVVDHAVLTRTGDTYAGTWDEIVAGLQDATPALRGKPVFEFMLAESARILAQTGMVVSVESAEAFVRSSAGGANGSPTPGAMYGSLGGVIVISTRGGGGT